MSNNEIPKIKKVPLVKKSTSSSSCRVRNARIIVEMQLSIFPVYVT